MQPSPYFFYDDKTELALDVFRFVCDSLDIDDLECEDNEEI